MHKNVSGAMSARNSPDVGKNSNSNSEEFQFKNAIVIYNSLLNANEYSKLN